MTLSFKNQLNENNNFLLMPSNHEAMNSARKTM